MDPLNQYTIPFVGLKVGKHYFEYKIEDKFFEQFEFSPVKSGDLNVELEFDKQETFFVLTFKIRGSVELTCDRCMEPFGYPIEVQEKQIIKFDEEEFDNTDDILIIAPNEHELNVAGLIYEFIIIAIPFIHYHPDKADGTSDCNPEVLAKLKELRPSEEHESPEDPRWDALRKIKDQD